MKHNEVAQVPGQSDEIAAARSEAAKCHMRHVGYIDERAGRHDGIVDGRSKLLVGDGGCFAGSQGSVETARGGSASIGRLHDVVG